ncbi:MAG: GMC family oxidoreductase [Proteobacteria bacterium]|nr:GMC family oxidoreductase [Pseudomonadota bacterium]
MPEAAPFIVVGSGASATVAASCLLDAGHRVLMLDSGDVDGRYAGLVPERPFDELRRTDAQQHRYLLGEDYEGIDLGNTGPLAQATAPRRFVFRRAMERLRSGGDSFAAIESLARGGLAEAWGAGAFPFTPHELRCAGLDPAEMAPHYEAVARLIGISGGNDDLAPWCGALSPLQPALAPDHNAAALLSTYARRKPRIEELGMRLGRPMLAVLSQPLGARRRANPMHGLDFWSNAGSSVFRPSVLLDDLKARPGFDYRPQVLVTRFDELEAGGVRVTGRDLQGGGSVEFLGERLILGAGALGSTRIALRSLDRHGQPVPFVCNEHAYIPSVRWGGLGKGAARHTYALAQLTAMLDPSGDQQHLVQAQFFSFTGMLLARLLKDSPLDYRDSLKIFQALATSFVILGVQHEDLPGAGKHLALRQAAAPEDDVLDIHWRPGATEQAAQRAAEKVFCKALRVLRCWPLRVIHPGAGASIHYAGTLPPSDEERPLTLDRSGRLRGTRNVYVCDGAGLAYLPAKGPTLTLMANARRIASRLIGSAR